MGLYSFFCKCCGSQYQEAALEKCIVCFEYNDWVGPLESEFKARARQLLPLNAADMNEGDEAVEAGEKDDPLEHVRFEDLRQEEFGGTGYYEGYGADLSLETRREKLAQMMAQVPGTLTPEAEAALKPLVEEFATRVGTEAQGKEFHVLGEYSMYGTVNIQGFDDAVGICCENNRGPVEWEGADGEQFTAKPKWAYCHGAEQCHGEGEHGIRAGDVRRCCPIDVAVYEEMPRDKTAEPECGRMYSQEKVGKMWGMIVDNNDAVDTKLAADRARMNNGVDMMAMLMAGLTGPVKDPRVELWLGPTGVILNTPPHLLAAYAQSLLTEGRVEHLAIARHGIVGVELLNGMDPDPMVTGNGARGPFGLLKLSEGESMYTSRGTNESTKYKRCDMDCGESPRDDAQLIPRPLVQAATLSQPETVKRLLGYGASLGVEDAVAAAQVALQAAQAEVARFYEPGQPGALAAEAHFKGLAGGGSVGACAGASPVVESEGPDKVKVKYIKESIYVNVDVAVHTVKHLRAVLCGLTGVDERLQKLLCAGRTLLPLVDAESLGNVGVKNGSVLMMTASKQEDIDRADRASHCLLSKTGRKKLNKEWFSKEPESEAPDEEWIAGTAAGGAPGNGSSKSKKNKKKR